MSKGFCRDCPAWDKREDDWGNCHMRPYPYDSPDNPQYDCSIWPITYAGDWCYEGRQIMKDK